MEPRSGTHRKIKPRCIVNYSTSRRPAIDAYGASVLWAEGKADAAIRVEQLWDEVGKTFGLDILCGYALSSFHGEEDEHVFQSICAKHSAIYSQ